VVPFADVPKRTHSPETNVVPFVNLSNAMLVP